MSGSVTTPASSRQTAPKSECRYRQMSRGYISSSQFGAGASKDVLELGQY
jgi:hypothetical protein